MEWHVPGYQVEYLVGTGGSGDVWRARRIEDDQLVALKRIRIDDDVLLRAARAEAALLAAFDHPHIVRLQELLVVDGAAVLVMDFAEGGSLAQVLERRSRLAPGEVATIVAPIAAALATAHGEGVVHCDVSPANILFAGDGRPMLADLGFARLRGQSEDVVHATPGYLDSAVAAGGAPGPHSDVFSLAAVAWRALTGSAVWESPTIRESLVLAAGGKVPPVREKAPATPEALGAAIDRALQPDPHLRGSAAELALDVRHAVTPVPVDGWSGGAPRDPAGLARAREQGSAGPAATVARHRRVEHPNPASARSRRRRREPSAAPRASRRGADSEQTADPRHAPAAQTPTAGRPSFRRPQAARHEAARHEAARNEAAAAQGTWPQDPWQQEAPGRQPAGHAARPATVDVTRAPSSARTRAVRRQPTGGAEQPPASGAPRRLLAGLGSAALIAAVVIGAWWTRHDSEGSPRTRTSGASAEQPGSAAERAGAAAEPDDQFAAWSAELARLDGIRQRAYAARDAELLAGVYTGPLHDADAAQLLSLVPAGCGLIGASSQYVISSAEETGEAPARRQVLITATATLGAGTLMCDGAARGVSAGIEPTTLQIVLAPGDDGLWRISEERRA